MAQRNIDSRAALILISGLFWCVIGAGYWLSGGFTPRTSTPSKQSDQVTNQLPEFKAAIELSDPSGKLFDNSRTSQKQTTATIVVTEQFKGLSEQTKLQIAQNLQRIWANLVSPSNPDKAYLKLVDARGSSVVRSRGEAATNVVVDDF